MAVRRALRYQPKDTVSWSRRTSDIKLHDACDGKPQMPFHFSLWLFLTVENWVFDFGRPFYALLASDWFPLSRPSIGDYCHMGYNIATALCVLQLLDRCSRPVPKILQHLLVVVFVMGSSIHLVGDSVQHRLVHIGYKLHLPLEQNPVMADLQPPGLREFFKLLDFYDEHLGHWVWYIPLFTTYVFMFYGGFTKGRVLQFPTSGWLLLLPSAVFEWYMVTEGQIIVPFLLMMVAMTVLLILRWHENVDSNGQWLYLRGLVTLALIIIWVACLWNDEQLREKYPGLLYVPEPWSYASLYVMN